ncbi:5-(carboxyamino)imidazole ribonucleotide synthase [Oscillatoria sp. FACHB-1406]|uniref:5-(carboxyamino)imidazole ribonucleotide synthase n=1 Tax=Oscillatoria sp. FACHB-1406 TaxID=2692846 RepID=UPI0016892BB7|nr:5-(carboxyamino)imidazole ribonucleotide synthase [Oscillatoria sp. FACHB-1406]MBD2577611.1 5-(carboxyamino)imidazole ribonucleotide synthase [Oscillatoria sp. FACHB-1406]
MSDRQIQNVGIIGGGQLAWMMADAAQKLNLNLIVQTPHPSDPAASIADRVILAPIDDAAATAQLAALCDVITFENEFIDLEALQAIARQDTIFRPRLQALAPLLDKYDQRSYFKSLGLPVPDFRLLDEENPDPPDRFPAVLKARRHGYDGYGTFIVKSQEEFSQLWERLNRPSLLLEEFVPFEKELAIMAARGATGEIALYPVVETQQEKEVCRRVIAPADISPEVSLQVSAIAQQLLNRLEVIGIFGIELFLTRDGKISVNEIAPRTHNSGHYTLDACDISQFEMHLRAVAGLPLATPQLTNCEGAVMVNLLGYETSHCDYAEKRAKLAEIPNARVHWYGKSESRPGRKLGHITVLLQQGELEKANAIARRVEALWYSREP